jgi:hypothetical protein
VSPAAIAHHRIELPSCFMLRTTISSCLMP